MEKTYTALENIRHNGKRYTPLDDIELDDKAAKQLLELNAVKLKAAEAEAKAKAEAEAAAEANTGKGKAKAK